MYEFFKTLHIVGVVVLLVNVTLTAYWKCLPIGPTTPNSLRTRSTASRLLIGFSPLQAFPHSDWWIGRGSGASLFATRSVWLVVGQLLFAASGLIWLCILVPIQIRQARMVRSLTQTNTYRRDSRTWLLWGSLQQFPLVVAIYVMVAKPA